MQLTSYFEQCTHLDNDDHLHQVQDKKISNYYCVQGEKTLIV